MTPEESARCLSILRTAYPSSYSKNRVSDTDAENLIYLWSTIFADEPYEVVLSAIMDLMTTKSEWAPDIAAVKQRIREMSDAVTGEPTDQDLWEALTRAVSNSAYGADEEFQKLPEEARSFAGSPSGLRRLASLDSDTFQSVTRGQFFRQISDIRSRRELSNRMPPALKSMIAAFVQRARIPEPEDRNSMEAVNSRRNELLRGLQ